MHFPSHQKLELTAHANITLTVKTLICFKSALRKDLQKPSLMLRAHPNPLSTLCNDDMYFCLLLSDFFSPSS